MLKREFDEIVREHFDLSDSYTCHYIATLEDAGQDQLINALSSALYDKIVTKVGDIDFGTIPASRGDINKVEGFDSTQEALDIMKKLIMEYKMNTAIIDVVLASIVNIQERKGLFIKGYAKNAELPMLVYNLAVLSVIRSTSLMIATCIEVVKDPKTSDLVMALDKAAYSKTMDDMLYQQLVSFNNMCNNGQLDKMLESSMNNVVKEDAVDNAEQFGIVGPVNDEDGMINPFDPEDGTEPYAPQEAPVDNNGNEIAPDATVPSNPEPIPQEDPADPDEAPVESEPANGEAIPDPDVEAKPPVQVPDYGQVDDNPVNDDPCADGQCEPECQGDECPQNNENEPDTVMVIVPDDQVPPEGIPGAEEVPAPVEPEENPMDGGRAEVPAADVPADDCGSQCATSAPLAGVEPDNIPNVVPTDVVGNDDTPISEDDMNESAAEVGAAVLKTASGKFKAAPTWVKILTAIGLAAAGTGAVMYITKSGPIEWLRHIVYLFYYSKLKIKDDLEVIAAFLEANADDLEYSDEGDEDKNKKVAKKQRKFAEKLRQFANKFSIDKKKSESETKKQKEKDKKDKRKVKKDEDGDDVLF